MSRAPERGGADFELTVHGRLGPVLRRALHPSSVVETRTCTTIRSVSSADLPDLVRLLDSHGLRIEGVWRVPRGRPGAG
ncbi:hypothetical protein [Nocardioides euryhalodurans]|uniref:Uncharacterized protein n=1 Tax=Nocardioides euryhalodurans TaxID=2518370 RepID=A0A4P7GIG3_9ACTN|nr:hypothetical protein [Nocardioides euryhalodurans]QBR91479.1 hypothetical protein EXE57_03755 [Nocardioides euryhalodurans]